MGKGPPVESGIYSNPLSCNCERVLKVNADEFVVSSISHDLGEITLYGKVLPSFTNCELYLLLKVFVRLTQEYLSLKLLS